jgi:hypothetical protein
MLKNEKKNQFEKAIKKITWVNLLNPRLELWNQNKFIECKLKNIMKLYLQQI